MPFNVALHVGHDRAMLKKLHDSSLSGFINEEAFSREPCTLRTDASAMVISSLPPGLPYSVLPVHSLFLGLFHLFLLDKTGFMTNYIMESPGTLSTIVRLILHSNYPVEVINLAMQCLMLMVLSPSPKRSEIVTTLRHWRFGQSLYKLGLSDPHSPLYASSSALYTALESSDLCRGYESLKLPISAPSDDEIWWASRVSTDPDFCESTATTLGFKIKWIPSEDGTVVNVDGVLLGAPIRISGSFDTATGFLKLSLPLESAQSTATFKLAPVISGSNAHFFTGFTYFSGGEDNPTCSCLFWRDSHQNTLEARQGGAKYPLSTPTPSWFSPPPDEATHSLRLFLRYMNATNHSLRTFDVEYILYAVFELRVGDTVSNPPPKWLTKYPGENDATFSSRHTAFQATLRTILTFRLEMLEAYCMSNLEIVKRDRETILSSLRMVYASLSEEFLIAIGAINPESVAISTKDKLMEGLHSSDPNVVLGFARTVANLKTTIWRSSPSEVFLEASAKVLEAVIRTGITQPTNTFLDFKDVESPLNAIYRKYTAMLMWSHPALCPHEDPFSFELQLALLCSLILKTEECASEHEPSIHTSTNDAISPYLNISKSGRGGFSYSHLLTLIAAGALSAAAIGFGAFMIGRRMNKNS